MKAHNKIIIIDQATNDGHIDHAASVTDVILVLRPGAIDTLREDTMHSMDVYMFGSRNHRVPYFICRYPSDFSRKPQSFLIDP